MELSIILMIIGIFFIIISLFLRDSAKKVEKEVEELSISIFQETNQLKRRLKIVEEELMLEPNFQVAKKKQAHYTAPSQTYAAQPINSILVSQVLELNKQGLAVSEISKLSTLSEEQIHQILATGGKL
ncbi:hypothetical protein MHH70_03880 [Metasolibacillus sp. FSL H7-0170]|uniref:hypothetical protein n=1 Tax=Metasolibacillus TaxID=2703677 RepID=UPI00079AD417|nr:hypothetical protein [Metasolibacillus fluoroglycofenilyticus]KYG92196.1 hypothetical protein A0U40_04440 [[Bacillus] sp. KCTC 13219]